MMMLLKHINSFRCSLRTSCSYSIARLTRNKKSIKVQLTNKLAKPSLMRLPDKFVNIEGQINIQMLQLIGFAFLCDSPMFSSVGTTGLSGWWAAKRRIMFSTSTRHRQDREGRGWNGKPRLLRKKKPQPQSNTHPYL